LNLTAPFFVRYNESDHNLGKTRNIVCIYQEKSTILCVYIKEKRHANIIYVGATY